LQYIYTCNITIVVYYHWIALQLLDDAISTAHTFSIAMNSSVLIKYLMQVLEIKKKVYYCFKYTKNLVRKIDFSTEESKIACNFSYYRS